MAINDRIKDMYAKARGLPKVLALCAAAAVSPVGASTAAKAAEPGETYGTGSVAVCPVGFQFDRLSISHSPTYVRDQGIHPDDWYASDSNAGNMDERQMDYPWFEGHLLGSVGVGHKFSEVSLEAGVLAKYILGNAPNDIEERNYTNHPGSSQRGYGAALTYYGFKHDILDPKQSFVPGVYVRITGKEGEDIEKFSDWLFAEYSLEYRSYYLSEGYDRYDKLETESVHKLADVFNNTVKAGVLLGDIAELYVGYNFPVAKLTQLGEDCDAKVNSNFIIGIDIGFNSEKWGE